VRDLDGNNFMEASLDNPRQSPLLDRRLTQVTAELPEYQGKKILHCKEDNLQDTQLRVTRLGYIIVETKHFIDSNVYIIAERPKPKKI
jgi:hypothetical protein